MAAVKVAIRNRTTLKWWSGSAWVNGTAWLSGAVLSNPGAPVTGWSFSWTAPAAGLYSVTVRAEDAVANSDATRPWLNFSVS